MSQTRKRKDTHRQTAIRTNVHDYLATWWVANGKRRVRVPAVVDELLGKEAIAPANFYQDQLLPDEMRALLAMKGWTVSDAAEWWGMRPETLSRFIANRDRPRYVDDLVWGLAPYSESSSDQWRRSLVGLVEAERRRTNAHRSRSRGNSASSFCGTVMKFPGPLR
jgi:hypothetical protein